MAAVWLGAATAQAQLAAAPNAAPTPASALTLLTVAVPCTDLARSIAFYTKGLGLTAAGRLDTPNATEAPLIFPGGGPGLLLVKSKAEGDSPPARGPLNRVILTVSDVKGLQARLAAAGYPLKSSPAAEPQHHVVVGVAEDPDGNLLELVQRTR